MKDDALSLKSSPKVESPIGNMYMYFYDPKWKEEFDVVNVMKQANSIWKFRHKIKELGWDNYNTTDEEIKAHILKGEKIAAIKLYRKHQCQVCGKQVSLKEAKEYVDAIQKTLSIT